VARVASELLEVAAVFVDAGCFTSGAGPCAFVAQPTVATSASTIHRAAMLGSYRLREAVASVLSSRVRGKSFVLIACALSGCTSEHAFGDDFIFGAALAGFQIEMGCPTLPAAECEDRNADWYEFVTSTVTQSRDSNHLSGDPTSRGPGYFELWREDIARLSELNLDGFRFSVEWSRVFPTSTAGIDDHAALKAVADADALAYYRAQLDALAAAGITPLVTLNHYTLPTWIHDAVGCNTNLDTCSPRGWLEPNFVEEIAKYAGFVAAELGDRVDVWATMNEPFAVVLPGYLLPTETRSNPPGQSFRYTEARQVITKMIRAHAAMSDAIRMHDTMHADEDGHATRVGLVYPITPVRPKDPSARVDRLGAKNGFYLLNEVFLNGVLAGKIDEDLDGVATEDPTLVGRSDYLGVNYYTAALVEGDTDSFSEDFSPLLTINPLTIEQGEPDPAGLLEMLRYVKSEFGDVPIYITENGTFPEITGGQERFLIEHLQQITRAVNTDEIDVRGYFWWSLIDNYEWNHGMALRFGLYEVPPDDPMKPRILRPFASEFSRIAEAGAIPSDLIEKYPAP